MSALFSTAILVVALMTATPAAAQKVIYVDTDAAGTNDGSSWTNAFVFLQDALAVATGGDEVWVAEGVYRPDRGTGVVRGDRNSSFRIAAGVKVYGGFSGREAGRDDRANPAHKTLLSGDLLGNDVAPVVHTTISRQDNSVHVVTIVGTGPETILDGFEIAGGNANSGFFPNNVGAGILIDGARVAITDLVIRDNAAQIYGGGMWAMNSHLKGNGLLFSNNYSDFRGGGLYGERSTIELRGSTLLANVAGNEGGGFYAWASDVRFAAVRYINNRGSGVVQHHGTFVHIGGAFLRNEGGDAGAIVLDEVRPALIANSVFAGNGAGLDSGAISLVEATVARIVNCTFANNQARDLGATTIYVSASSASLANSIVWPSGPTQRHLWVEGDTNRDSQLRVWNSIIRGGLPPGAEDEGGNLGDDPVFVDPRGADGIEGTDDDGLWVAESSPAIDAGKNTSLPADSLDLDGDGNLLEALPIDNAGSPRVWDTGEGSPGGTVDMGAYEFGGIILDSGGITKPFIDKLVVVEAYPNPATDRFKIILKFGRSEQGAVQIVDTLGRVMGPASQFSGLGGSVIPVTISVKHLPAGKYVAVFRGTHAAVSVSFLKVN